MELVVSHMSALDFWRLVYSPARTLGAPPSPPGAIGRPAVNEPDVWSLAPQWVTPEFLAPEGGVLHVLATSAGDRRASCTHRAHQWTAPIPDGALYGFGDGTYVCSPGFAFLQMADVLDLPELTALAFELCGTYLFDYREERGFQTRACPLVEPAQLVRFLESAKGVRGQRPAMRAMRHVVAGSASPRETLTSMLLALPCRLGGYGLPPMELNRRIDLPPRAQRLYHKPYVKADLCYPDSRLAIEYLGDRDHTGADAVHSDRSRTNALVEAGFGVIELTSNQVNDCMAFDVVAQQVAKRLGKRVRTENRGVLPARTALRKALFAWNAASGRRALDGNGAGGR